MCFSSVALILSSAFSSAQTPTPTPPCSDSTQPSNHADTKLDPPFQPHYYDSGDNTELHHNRIAPSGTGPWPIVITIPPVLFQTETGTGGTAAQRAAAKELTDHGFLVYQVEHRLAPPGRAMGQTGHNKNTQRGIDSGRPPQQTDDLKQQILAAMEDDDWDEANVFIIGGSSGASHALWLALDSTQENVTGWTAARSKIKGVVCFSGVYDFTDRDFDNQGQNFDPDTYLGIIHNYTNTTDSFVGLEKQYSVSPKALLVSATNIPPIRLYATLDDTIPHNQSENMYEALLDHGGVDVMEFTMEGEEHSFNQWYIQNNLNNNTCVREEVITFLEAQL